MKKTLQGWEIAQHGYWRDLHCSFIVSWEDGKALTLESKIEPPKISGFDAEIADFWILGIEKRAGAVQVTCRGRYMLAQIG